MNIEVKTNNYLPILGLTSVISLNAYLNEYEHSNKKLSGKINLMGKCIINNTDENLEKEINEILPFEIIFTNDVNKIDNVMLESFEFFEVERRGIEMEVTLIVNCSKEEVVDNMEETSESITKEIDFKLQDELNNDSQIEEEITLPTYESKSRIRLF